MRREESKRDGICEGGGGGGGLVAGRLSPRGGRNGDAASAGAGWLLDSAHFSPSRNMYFTNRPLDWGNTYSSHARFLDRQIVYIFKKKLESYF